MSDIITLMREADNADDGAGKMDPEQNLLQEIIRRGPQTRREFGIYVVQVLGPILEQEYGDIIDIKESLVEGHVSPIDALWGIICLAVGRNRRWKPLNNKQLRKAIKKYVLHAPRGGMKTLGMAIIEHTLCYYNAGYSISHTAKQDQQVDQVWEYLKAFVGKGTPFYAKCEKATIHRIKYKNRSNIYRVACTRDGLNSKHPNMFVVDEVETAEWSTLVEGIFSGQSKMRKTGLRWPLLYIFASTQKQARATMFYLFKECDTGEAVLMRWNWKTIVEKCTPDRYEELPAEIRCEDYKQLALSAAILEAKLQRNLEEEEELMRINFKIRQLQDNCVLVSRCNGIAKQGKGYKGIDDLVNFLTADADAFDVQLGCDRPSMENAVYSKLGDDNRDKLLLYNPGAEQIGSVDFGYSVDVTAILLGNRVGTGIEVWYERDIENCDEDSLVPILVELTRRYGIERWSVDPSARQLINKMLMAGLQVWASKILKHNGIGNVAHYICDGRGHRRLKYNPTRCPKLDIQMKSYWKKPNGKPTEDRKEGHHWDFCDSLRYLCNMCRLGIVGGSREIRQTYRR